MVETITWKTNTKNKAVLTVKISIHYNKVIATAWSNFTN